MEPYDKSMQLGFATLCGITHKPKGDYEIALQMDSLSEVIYVELLSQCKANLTDFSRSCNGDDTRLQHIWNDMYNQGIQLCKGPYPTACNLDGLAVVMLLESPQKYGYLAHVIIAQLANIWNEEAHNCCQPISEFKHSARSHWDKDYLHSVSRNLEDSHAQKEFSQWDNNLKLREFKD